MTARALGTVAVLGTILIAGGTGCERSTSGLGPAPVDTDPVVFLDTFGAGVGFQAFLDTKLDAVSLDAEQRYEGRASLRVTVPAPWDDTGLFAGGALTAAWPRDLSGYNALTFRAKASMAATLNVAGLGNDNTGTSKFLASWSGIPLTTSWTEYVVPIPLPSRLAVEQGLFFFAEGYENDRGYDLWFDEIRFENVSTVSDPRPSLFSSTEYSFVGQAFTPDSTWTLFNVDGLDQRIDHQPGYFTFLSSDDSVATVTGGTVTVVGPGTASITAMLGQTPVAGTVTVNATLPPMERAPVPTHPASDVISLFSNTYVNRTVDTWSATWDQGDVFDFQVDGDDIKAYTKLGYAGIEFTSSLIDASEMTHFHVDVWGPDGFYTKVKLVDFGADGESGGGDDSPAVSDARTVGELITPGEWTSLDIPFTKFYQKTGLTDRTHLAQLIFVGNGDVTGAPTILYVDNIYFHR